MKSQFDKARAHENYQRWQLSMKTPEETRGKIDALKVQENQAIKAELLRQNLSKEIDLTAEKEKLKEEAIRQSKLSSYLRTERYTEDRIKELAERNLETINKEKIDTISKESEGKVDQELAKSGLWIGPVPQREPRVSDALDRFYARNEQSMDNRGHENER